MLFVPKERFVTPHGSINFNAAGIKSVAGIVKGNSYTSVQWVRFTASPGDYALSASISTNNYTGLALIFGGDIGIIAGNGGVFAPILTFVQNLWYCVAYTVTPVGGNQNAVGYARLATSAKFTTAVLNAITDTSTGSEVFYISNDNQSDGYFPGVIGGFKLWNRALTAAEVLEESLQLAPVSQRGLVSYLPFRGANQELIDKAKGGTSRWSIAGGTAFPSVALAPPVPEVRNNKAIEFYLTHSAGGAIASVMGASSSLSGTLTGAGALASAMAAVSSLSPNLKASGALASTMASVSSLSPTISSTSALASTMAAASSLSGTLAGAGALASTMASSSTLSGTLTAQGALASTMAATSTESGTLGADGALASTMASSSTESGTLTASGALSSTMASTSTESGTLTAAGVLASTMAAVSTESGTLSSTSAITSTMAAVSTESGTLTGAGALSAAMAAASTESGTLTADGALSSVMTAVSTESGTLTGRGALASTMASASALSGTLQGAGALSSTMAAVSTLSGTLGGSGALESTMASAATLDGTLGASGALSSEMDASSTLSGTLIDNGGSIESVMAASSTLSGTLGAEGTLSSTMSSTATYRATAEQPPPPPPAPQKSKGTVGPDLPPVTYQEPWWVDPLGQDTPRDIPLRLPFEEAPLVIIQDERGIETPYEVVVEPEPEPELEDEETFGDDGPQVLIDQSTKVYAPDQSTTTTTNITHVYAAPLTAPASTWLDRGKKIAAWVGVMALSAVSGFLVAANIKTPKRRRPKPKPKRKARR